MTQEEKAKAYDKALEQAAALHRFSSDLKEIKRMEELFPELKESEDEKIRKGLIYYLKSLRGKHELFPDEWIAWLEKQGEQKPVEKVWHDADETPIGAGDKEILVQFTDYHTSVVEIDDWKYLDHQTKWAYLSDLLTFHEHVEWNEEDERIRKAQLDYWRSVGGKEWHGVSVQETIAWLEKQKPIEIRTTGFWNVQEMKTSEEVNNNNKDILKDVVVYSNEDGLVADTIKQREKKLVKQNKNETVDKLIAIAECLEADGDCSFNGYKGTECGKFLRELARKEIEQKPYGQREECKDCQMNYAGECKGYCAMKRNEQKPADKIEPKFKVGDWCIDNEDGTIFQIVKVLDNTYTYETNEGKEYHCTHYSLENDARLWTIQDAKDGDVLYSPCCKLLWIYKDEKTCHVGSNLNYNSGSIVINKPVCIPTDAIPATKEQHNLLFKEMKEAGYEWDAEKKELKKIEQSPIEEVNGEDYGIDGLWHAMTILEKTLGEVDGYQSDDGILEHKCAITAIRDLAKKQRKQKPTWSEEDERNLQGIIDEIKANKNNAPDYDLATYDRFLSWLKSLKDRVHPKQEWSEKDENRLEDLIDYLEMSDIIQNMKKIKHSLARKFLGSNLSKKE